MLGALRRQPGCENIAVIMLTARSLTQDIVKANTFDIEDYIIKPFDFNDLLEKIEQVIEYRKALAK